MQIQNEVAEQETQLKKERNEKRQLLAKRQQLENRIIHISNAHQVEVEELIQKHNHKVTPLYIANVCKYSDYQIKQTNDSFNAELDDIRSRVGLILEEKNSKIDALQTKIEVLSINV